jgi:hypothetical protein
MFLGFMLQSQLTNVSADYSNIVNLWCNWNALLYFKMNKNMTPVTTKILAILLHIIQVNAKLDSILF